MAQTFYEMMNTVRFRDIAGCARSEADLWALRDTLFELQTDVQRASVLAHSSIIAQYEQPELREQLMYPYRLMVNMLEADILTIEAYLRKNKIDRR